MSNQPGVLVLTVRIPDAPRFLDILLDRIMDAGALDAWTTPIIDRDGRPGITLTITAPVQRRHDIEGVIATNSSASAIIATPADVTAIQTSSELVTTRWGDIAITHRHWQGRIIDIEPDADACAAFARQHDIPASTVWNETYRIGEARIGQKR
jgi:pyridinium-3,5-bisthiocarboxylic acid mononucleotide nickel chelatase